MYILVTPAKNEEENLLEVASSVANQTIKPILWLIVDDGSTDRTPEILQNIQSRYNWIKSIRLPPKPRDITFHYSYVCKKGFDYAIEFCKKNNIYYEYIGLLDADTVLTKEYFEKLFGKFCTDPSLGIASGGVYYKTNGKLKLDTSNVTHPRGTGRIWNKKCFFDTEGYVVEPSPDSISNIKAILRGWNICQFKEIVEFQTRVTSSSEGLWKGYSTRGWVSYYLNKNPLLVIFNVIYISSKYPYYLGMAYLAGYIKSFINRDQKIKDVEIMNYYQHARVQEVLNRYFE